MSDELFLILHRVRGEPAFDIATRCDDMGTSEDPGPWWIIPTSGHRAYPFLWWPLGSLTCMENALPSDWPDHYPDQPSPSAPRVIGGLLSILGLGRSPGLRRRKF